MAPAPRNASIGRLIGSTVLVGTIVGVVTGLTLRWIVGIEDRAQLAALTASITAAVTCMVAMIRVREEYEARSG